MNIYKISQNVKDDFYDCLSAIVVAPTAEAARYINPVQSDRNWVNPDLVEVELLGTAAPNFNCGVIMVDVVPGI